MHQAWTLSLAISFPTSDSSALSMLLIMLEEHCAPLQRFVKSATLQSYEETWGQKVEAPSTLLPEIKVGGEGDQGSCGSLPLPRLARFFFVSLAALRRMRPHSECK